MKTIKIKYITCWANKNNGWLCVKCFKKMFPNYVQTPTAPDGIPEWSPVISDKKKDIFDKCDSCIKIKK